SLAILVIGFAGAFCFRNEEFVENGLKLARSKILDEGIAQRPGPKPYVADGKPDPAPVSKPTVTLGGIEAIEPVEAPRIAQQPQKPAPTTLASKSPPIGIDSSPRAPKARMISVEKPRPTPEPVPTEVGPSASTSSVIDKPIELSIRPSTPAFAQPDTLLEES